MNLAEALIQALPELPTQTFANRKFKFNPDLVIREEISDDGHPVKIVFVPEKTAMYYLEGPQFELFQLFDGERDFAQVAEAYREATGVEMSEQDVKEFALASVDTGLWFESAQERNITLSQKLRQERQRRIKQKGKFTDLSHIIFKGWDPDKFLTWVHEKLWFVYTRWFTVLTLCAFGLMTWIWIDRWTEIGHDTLLFYTFTEKSAGDIAEFWLLFLFMAFFHESAHGLTAKHYGASVHNMGFQLIYLAPAFAIEITELWARVGRRERLLAIIAGVWMEMIFCAAATFVWWGTPAGTAVHEWAYKLMMITGIVVLIVNLNPLMKLDGYYAFAEIVGVSELKERSTAFLSGWVKRHVFGLPVEFDYVPPRRRWLFVPYAILSGAYSYGLLFAVSRFTYNVCHRFWPAWAFIPAGLVAWKIFKSRILRFLSFMKTVYVHNEQRIGVLGSRRGRLALAAGALVVLFVPVFHKTADTSFILEPVQRAMIRAKVPGFVQTMYVDENSPVSPGTPIAVLRDSNVSGDLHRAEADLSLAEAGLAKAELSYVALAASRNELQRAGEVAKTAHKVSDELRPTSPISGVVTTPRARQIQGSYVAAGALLAEVEDVSRMRARLYLPEYELREVHVGSPVSLRMNSRWTTIKASVTNQMTTPSELPEGFAGMVKYRGLRPPAFYVVDVEFPNDGSLRSGMTGQAKILLRRQSLAGKAWEVVRDFVWSRVW